MTMPVQQPPAAPPAQPAPPAAPAPPEPGTPGTITIPATDPATGAFDPRTGDPAQPPAATDPGGVWGTGVQPATPPAPNGLVTPPGAPTPVPAPTAPGTPIQPVTVEGQQYFTAEALEEARRQEREKLYGRMETMGQELGTVRQFVDEERARREQAEKEVAEAAERERQANMSVEERMAALENSWQQRLQTAEQAMAQQAAVLEQERRLQAVEGYKSRRLSEEGDLIHPTLLDYVTGSTPEEIDASIVAAKAKTDAIVQDMQGQQVAQRQQMRTVAPTGAPPVGPSDNASGQQTFTAQDIAQMDSATYAKHRASLLQAVSHRAATGSLYQP